MSIRVLFLNMLLMLTVLNINLDFIMFTYKHFLTRGFFPIPSFFPPKVEILKVFTVCLVGYL